MAIVVANLKKTRCVGGSSGRGTGLWRISGPAQPSCPYQWQTIQHEHLPSKRFHLGKLSPSTTPFLNPPYATDSPLLCYTCQEAFQLERWPSG